MFVQFNLKVEFDIKTNSNCKLYIFQVFFIFWDVTDQVLQLTGLFVTIFEVCRCMQVAFLSQHRLLDWHDNYPNSYLTVAENQVLLDGRGVAGKMVVFVEGRSRK